MHVISITAWETCCGLPVGPSEARSCKTQSIASCSARDIKIAGVVSVFNEEEEQYNQTHETIPRVLVDRQTGNSSYCTIVQRVSIPRCQVYRRYSPRAYSPKVIDSIAGKNMSG